MTEAIPLIYEITSTQDGNIIDNSKTGTLTLYQENGDHSPLDGGSYGIYRVATLSSDGVASIVEELVGAGLSVIEFSESFMAGQTNISNLVASIDNVGLTPTQTINVIKGMSYAENLPVGMYVIECFAAPIGYMMPTAQMFSIPSLPDYNYSDSVTFTLSTP